MIVFNLYKGRKAYTYSRCYKTKVVRNKISGHFWNEFIPLNKWEISSPLVGVIQTVKSEGKAQKICSEYGEKDIYMPLTQRELDKIIANGWLDD